MRRTLPADEDDPQGRQSSAGCRDCVSATRPVVSMTRDHPHSGLGKRFQKEFIRVYATWLTVGSSGGNTNDFSSLLRLLDDKFGIMSGLL